MRWRFFLRVLLVLGAASGWWCAWHEHTQPTEDGFARRRLTFLEGENQRLAGMLAQEQQARDAANELSQRAAIEKTVADLRSLSFLKPVVYRQIPRTELPFILRQKIAQQVPDREFDANSVALAALGLIPSGTDLKKTYLALLGEQVGAFYDQHSAELFTFSGQSLDNSQNRVILAHELTHALEDQHFHLANLPLEAKGNDDRALAASALVEGDATLVMNRYLLGNLSASVVKDSLAGALMTDVRQLVAAPRFLRETLVFPYLRGQEFCQAVYDQGGWHALADAFHHPPTSTAQILHPQRFISHPAQQPVEIDYGNVLSFGQKPVCDNVAGEFGLRQLLIGWLGSDAQAGDLAANWAGDRYVVYGNAKVNSYLWCTCWSSEAAAKQFMSAAQMGWQVRYGIKPSAEHLEAPSNNGDPSRSSASCRLENGRELVISQEHQQVTLEEAQSSEWLSALNQVLTSQILPSHASYH